MAANTAQAYDPGKAGAAPDSDGSDADRGVTSKGEPDSDSSLKPTTT